MADRRPVGKFVSRGEAAPVAIAGNSVATLLAAAETAGRFAVRELAATPGAAAAPPLPDADNRYVFVVAGEWEIEAGSERRVVGAGVAIFVPAGARYAARLTGTRDGRLLEITAPVRRGG